MTFEMGFIFVALIQVVSFFIEGCAGFGSTVIAAPITTAFLGTAEGVPYGTVIALPFMYQMGFKTIKNVSWKDLFKILVLCAPGMVIGNYLFYTMSENTAKICIGTMICIIALMNIYKHMLKPYFIKKQQIQEGKEGVAHVEEEVDTTGKKIYRYGCLMLGGVVHGAFTIGGPLITVYTLEAVKEKEKYRNTMIWVWLILNTYNAVVQCVNGAFTPRMWSAMLIGLPMAAIGYYAGVKFLTKINREQFLRIVYVVLLIVGGDMLIRSILTVI